MVMSRANNPGSRDDFCTHIPRETFVEPRNYTKKSTTKPDGISNSIVFDLKSEHDVTQSYKPNRIYGRDGRRSFFELMQSR
jgi:hypothetical protein